MLLVVRQADTATCWCAMQAAEYRDWCAQAVALTLSAALPVCSEPLQTVHDDSCTPKTQACACELRSILWVDQKDMDHIQGI